jgi:predicted dehydrogenase
VRVAVLGQGSIGRRHAALLLELGHQVVSYDVRADAAVVDGVTRALSESAALQDVAAAIVASPPTEHLRQARLALERGVHTLVEKPFAPSAAGVLELQTLAAEHALVLGVAMNLRFHPGVRAVRRLIVEGAIGRPLRASVWCGSWLPGWRAGVDYRTTYSAQARLGGGVLLDMIHELDYTIWMLGPVSRVQAVLAHVSPLELDVEDVAALVLEHESGAISSITLDYFDHDYHRGCRVVGEHGSIDWSWEQQRVVCHSATALEPLLIATPSDVQPSYRIQLGRFLDAVGNGGSPATDAGEAAAALAVADGARRASDSGVLLI